MASIVRNKGKDIPSVSRIKALFDNKFGLDLQFNSEFHPFDLKDKTNKYVVEVKQRSIKHNKFPTVMMGWNKYIKARQYITRGYNVYFAFEYTDGTYIYKYDGIKYEGVMWGRKDRGFDETKKNIAIPIEKLEIFIQ
jgi:hypothetical protein